MRLLLLLSALHLAALVAVLLLPLAVWLKGLLSLPLLIGAGQAVRHHALKRGPAALAELTLQEDGTVAGRKKNGERFVAAVGRSSSRLPGLLIMNLVRADATAPSSVLIAADSLAAEDWRILRTWLRWKAG